jgi:hypothetical protein
VACASVDRQEESSRNVEFMALTHPLASSRRKTIDQKRVLLPGLLDIQLAMRNPPGWFLLQQRSRVRFPILLHTKPSPQPTLLLTRATVDFNICENTACYYTPHPRRRRLHIVLPQTKTLTPTFLPIPHTREEKKTHNRKTPKKIDVTLPIHSCAIPLHHHHLLLLLLLLLLTLLLLLLHNCQLASIQPEGKL